MHLSHTTREPLLISVRRLATPSSQDESEETIYEIELDEEDEVEEPKKEEPKVIEKVEAKADKLAGAKVLGKIDLDSINAKTRPSKKSKEDKEAEKAASAEASKKIFEANKPMLTHPDKIHPGQVLRIPTEA